MAEKFNKMSKEERMTWIKQTDKRIQTLYKELIEFEKSMSDEPETDPVKLLWLIDTLTDVYEDLKQMPTTNQTLLAKQDALRKKMELLQGTVALLSTDEEAVPKNTAQD